MRRDGWQVVGRTEDGNEVLVAPVGTPPPGAKCELAAALRDLVVVRDLEVRLALEAHTDHVLVLAATRPWARERQHVQVAVPAELLADTPALASALLALGRRLS